VSISLLLELAVATCPDRIAVGRLDDGVTFAELAERAAAAAGRLVETGPKSIAYLGLSGPAFHVALFAASHAGLPITPLNYRLSDAQLADLLAQLDRPVVVADPGYMAHVPSEYRVVDTGDLLTAPASDGAPPAAVDDESAAVILFTSGTTSAPKGVVLRHSHLVAYVLQTVNPGSADEGDAALVSVPPYHVAGVGTVLSNTVAGRRIVHLPDFTPAGWLDTVRTQRITNAMVVPTMLARIVDHLGGQPADAPTLTAIAYGGARVAAPVLAAALGAFPQAGFVNAYGLTETSSTIAILSPDDHRSALASDDPAIRARLTSTGRFIPGVEAQIRDDDGNALPAGQVGELWVRGPQVSGEYLGAGSVTDAAGWFPTRDRAHLDADGYLFVEGRADDTIIRGGENIAPAEIEDVLIEHAAVRDVCVVGVPDEEWGEIIVAVVVPHHEVDPETLRGHVRNQLRGSRTPDRVVFRDELPATPTGKILRRVLIAELCAPADEVSR
jgi:acyl-CoA synthetase (AMP-forming)/AMP-acid ligase II